MCEIATCPDYAILEGSGCLGSSDRLAENEIDHSQDPKWALTRSFSPDFVSLKPEFVQIMYVRAPPPPHTHTHTHTYIHTYIHTYTHACTHTNLFFISNIRLESLSALYFKRVYYRLLPCNKYLYFIDGFLAFITRNGIKAVQGYYQMLQLVVSNIKKNMLFVPTEPLFLRSAAPAAVSGEERILSCASLANVPAWKVS